MAGGTFAWIRLLVLGTCFWSAGQAGAATPLSRFPVRLQDTLLAAPLAIDLDGDGKLELALGSRKQLYLLKADGHAAAGFPLLLEKLGWLATPLAGGRLTIGGAAKTMLAFGSEDGRLVVVDGSGRVAAGFPVEVGGALSGAPTIADFDGDGGNEVVFATRAGQLWLVNGEGRTLAGWPSGCACEPSTPVTVGRLKPGGKTLLIFGDQQGRLHAWEAPGREAPGFPFESRYALYSQPVLGDLDDDGVFEVVFGSEDFKIYAVQEEGKLAAGFPAVTGYRIYSTPALADLNADGVVDVIVASGDGSLYAFGREGKPLAGFPQKLGNRLQSSPVAGDVDGDGQTEIAAGADDGTLWLIKADGKKYAGFPKQPSEAAGLSPLLVDLQADGTVEVVYASRDGTLSAYSLLRKGRAGRGLCWPTEGRDPQRSGRTWPNPARYGDLVLEPKQARTTDTLRLAYRHFDLDGEGEPATIVRWFRDGKRVKELDGARQVPAEATRKHQRWWFTLQAGEKEPEFKSPELIIQNTPPEAPGLEILPAAPTCRSELELKIVREAYDADGDRIRYDIVWLKDRLPEKGLTGKKVPAKLLKKRQRWTAVVTPHDGEAQGPPARVAVTVVNTPPAVARVRLEPARPKITDKLRLVIEKPTEDADGDVVSHRTEWSVDGKIINLSEQALELPANLAQKGQTVRARVVSWDGEAAGRETTAEVRLVNSAPQPPSVRLAPLPVQVGQPLVAQVVSSGEDADGDPLTYRASWFRDGKAVADVSGFFVPAEKLKKHQNWRVSVVASDGEAESPPATAEARVANTAPLAPRLEAVNPRPTTNEELAVRTVTAAMDADGDPLSLKAVWFEQEKTGLRELARSAQIQPLGATHTRKHGRYLLEVTAADGEATSSPERVWFEVANTPPAGCRVVIQPQKPLGGEGLRAEVQPLADADGDAVEVALTWYRDGEPVEMGGERNLVQAGLVKKGQRWLVLGRPRDDEETGPPCQAEVEIGNRPPQAPRIALRPEKPCRETGLEIAWQAAAADLDGDKLRVNWKWLADGHTVAGLDGVEKVPGEWLRRGQKWTLEVEVSDGQASIPAIRAEAAIGNTRPGAPQIAVVPERPLSSDDLHCVLLAPARDADFDWLEYRYSWHRLEGAGAGEAVHQGPVLPAEKTRRDERWLCRVRAWDGFEEGEAVEAAVTLGNAAPGQAQVAIEPENPARGQELRCQVKEAAIDPDGDPVKYNFRWFKDGVLQQFAAESERVPGRLVSADDIWQCAVVPSDGRLEGPPAESAEVVIK